VRERNSETKRKKDRWRSWKEGGGGEKVRGYQIHRKTEAEQGRQRKMKRTGARDGKDRNRNRHRKIVTNSNRKRV